MADPQAPAPATVTGKDGKLFAWDPKAGEAVRLTPEELHASFTRGDVALVSDQSYPMLDPNGDTRMVPAKDVSEALHQGGYRFGNQLDVIRQEQRSPAGAYRAFADGVANRAAFGFGDAIQVAAGVDPDEIRIRAEENRGARTGGELVGAGVGALAMGALAPEGLLAAALPEASAATGMGAVATDVAGTAIEGATHGVGDAVSESALGKTSVTAENLIAHGGLGFALGGALGGALRVPAARMVRAADREALIEGASGATPKSLGEAWGDMVDAYKGRAGGAVAPGPNPLRVKDVGMPLPAAEAPGANTVLESLGEADVKGSAKELAALDKQHAAELKAFDRAQGKLEPAMTPAAQAEREQARAAVVERQAAERAKVEPVGYSRPEPTPFESAPTEFATPMPGAAEEGATRNLRRAKPAAAEEAGPSSPGPFAEGGFNNEAFYPPRAAAPAPGGAGIGGRGLAYMAGHFVGGAPGGFIAEQVVGSNPMRMAALARAGNVVKEYIGAQMGRMATGAARGALTLELPRSIAPATLSVLNARDGAERRTAFAKRMEELAYYGDDQSVSQKATDGTAHFEQDIPDATAAVRAKSVQIATYLRQAAPKPLVVRNPMNPRPSYDMVSDRDAQRFAELDAALQDPLRIVQQLGSGQVPAPEVMMGFRTNYPELYNQAVQSFKAALAEHPGDISWETTMRAGIAFGLSSHPSLVPANLAAQQAAIQAPPPAPAGAPRSARGTSPRGASLAAPSTAAGMQVGR